MLGQVMQVGTAAVPWPLSPLAVPSASREGQAHTHPDGRERASQAEVICEPRLVGVAYRTKRIP